MKIRTLVTGVALALAIAACGSHATLPPSAPASSSVVDMELLPADTTAERTGGGMGSGN